MFSIIMLWILTQANAQLQNVLNPFYSSLSNVIRGQHTIADNVIRNYYLEYLPPNFHYFSLFILISIGLIIVLLSYFLIPKELTVNRHTSEKINKKRLGNIPWEFFKQNNFSKNTIIYPITFMLLSVLIFITIAGDQYLIQANVFKDSRISSYRKQLDEDSANLEREKGLLAEANSEEETEIQKRIDLLESQIAYYMEIIDDLSVLKSFYLKGDSMSYYQRLQSEYSDANSHSNPNQVIGRFVSENPLLTPDDLENKEISEFSKLVNTHFRELLIESEVKPLALHYDQALTYYDKTTDMTLINDVITEQLPKESSSFMLLYRLFQSRYLGLLLVLISCGLFGANYYLDFETGNQLAFLNTSSMSSQKIFISKFVAGLIKITKYLLIAILFILIVELGASSNETLNFPILKYIGVVNNPMEVLEYSQYYDFITIKQYLIESLSLIYLGAVFTYSLLHLYSTFLRSRAQIYFVTALTFLVMLILLLLLPEFAGYNPITYLYSSRVVTGEIGVRFGLLNTNVLTGAMILGLSSIVLFVVGLFLSDRNKV